MRKIEGYICLVRRNTPRGIAETMFGKNTGSGTGMYQNFQSNNLTPFPNIREVKRAKKELKARTDFGPKTISLALVKIFLMETEGEISVFQKKKRSLIVVKKDLDFGDTELVGRLVEGKPGIYPLYGALLEFNGMETINSFESARYIASEINRQAQCLAPIGTFHLKRL